MPPFQAWPPYQALVDEAERDYEGYWGRLARQFVSWKTPFTQVLDSSNAPFFNGSPMAR